MKCKYFRTQQRITLECCAKDGFIYSNFEIDEYLSGIFWQRDGFALRKVTFEKSKKNGYVMKRCRLGLQLSDYFQRVVDNHTEIYIL